MSKRSRESSPDSGVTLQVILDKLVSNETKIDTKLESIQQSITQEVHQLRQQLSDQNKVIDELRNRICLLEKRFDQRENMDIRRRVKFVFPAEKIECSQFGVKQAIIDILDDVGLQRMTLIDFFYSKPIDQRGKMRVFVTANFLSPDQVEVLCSNSFAIYKNGQVQVRRCLTNEIQAAMSEAIKSAYKDNDPKSVRIYWSKPAVLVGKQQVWPSTANKNRSSGNSYASAASPIIDKLIASEIQPLVNDTPIVTPVKLIGKHKLCAVLIPWDGIEIPSTIVDKSISNWKISFPIDKQRDNVIIAGLASNGGQVASFKFDDKEPRAGDRILEVLARAKMGAILVVLRKFGDTSLGIDRYRYFIDIAKSAIELATAGKQH